VGAILPLPSPVVGSVLADVLVQFFSHEESKWRSGTIPLSPRRCT